MDKINSIKSVLEQLANNSLSAKSNFYKTGKGDYAEHDRFIGVNVPSLRIIAKELKALTLEEIKKLLESDINEERLLALLVLVDQYRQGSYLEKENIYKFYIKNLKYVNNWNLVDSSAHMILGKHILSADKNILLTLAKSEILWERRIAIVATWHLIKNNQFDWTVKIARILLNDPHDLIHKAVGWMLREVGKRDVGVLKMFLFEYASFMPRTMLRYAIEKFSTNEKEVYMNKKKAIRL